MAVIERSPDYQARYDLTMLLLSIKNRLVEERDRAEERVSLIDLRLDEINKQLRILRQICIDKGEWH
jgi:hypothetical protein